MPTGGGGGGGGLSSVTTNATLTGAGTGGSPLAVAVPYNAAAPGALGGTTSSTAQLTQVSVGASVPALPGTTGAMSLAAGLATGGQAQPAQAGDVTISRTGSNTVGALNLGVGTNQQTIFNTADSQPAPFLQLPSSFGIGNVYFQIRNNINFASLPAPSATFKGALAMVSDSTVNTFGATVAGGGANIVLTWCNGTHWTVVGI